MPDLRHLRLEQDGRGVATVWFDVQDSPVNIFNDEVVGELQEVIGRLEAEPGVVSYLLQATLRDLSEPSRRLISLVAVFRHPVDLLDERIAVALNSGRDLWHATFGTMLAIRSNVDLSGAIDHSARTTVIAASAIIRF